MKTKLMEIVKGRQIKGSRNLKSNIALVLILVTTILTVTACGKSEKVVSFDVDKIEDRGYIVMGLDDTFAPMGFRDKNDELVGFDVDLSKAVFERANIELKLQPIEWSMKETELNTGNIDVIWNGYSITEERKEKVAFTEAYLENEQIIVTLADSDIQKRDDLEGKKVAVQNGSSALDAVNEYPDLVAKFDGGEPILFDTNNEALMDLEAGRSDAVVGDKVLIRYYVKQKDETNYNIIKEDFGTEEYGIGVRKTDKNLLKLINDTLNEMRADGSYDEIYNKWFSEK